MSETCVWKPRVAFTDSAGNRVEEDSQLYDDLVKYVGRNEEVLEGETPRGTSSEKENLSKLFYFLGKDLDFIKKAKKKFGDILNYQGEISLESLIKILHRTEGIKVKSSKTINVLRHEFGVGEYNYDEALQKVVNFNTTHAYRELFIATLTPVGSGRYKVDISDKTEAAEDSYKNTIRDLARFQLIKSAVEALGGNISYIDERYSKVTNVEVNEFLKGFTGTLELSSMGNTTEELANATGQFIAMTTHNSNIMQRLENLCTPEFAKVVLGDVVEAYSDDYIQSDKFKNEVAGILISNYLKEGNLDKFLKGKKDSLMTKMVNRIIDSVKSLYYKARGKKFLSKRLMLKANRIAEDIVSGLVTGNLEDVIKQSVVTTINKGEEHESILEDDRYTFSNSGTRGTTTMSNNAATFRRIIKRLDGLSESMSAIDRNLYDHWNKVKLKVAGGRLFKSQNTFSDIIAIEGMAVSLAELSERAEEMFELLDSVDLENYEESEVPVNSRRLRQVRAYLEATVNIRQLIATFLSDPEIVWPENTRDAIVDASEKIDQVISAMTTPLIQKEHQFYLNFLTGVWGKEYIETASRVTLNWHSLKLDHVDYSKKSSKEFIEEAIKTLSKDDNLMTRYITSCASSGDVVNGLAYKAKSAANTEADKKTIEAFQKIRVLEANAKKLGINTDRLFELDANGNRTGNYLSELNWGEWEKDWKSFRKEQEKLFFMEHKLDNLDPTQKEILWDMFFRPLAKQWHREHSVYNKEEGIYYPADGTKGKHDYTNYKYFKLSDQEKDFLQELITLKESFDFALLTEADDGSNVMPAHTNKFRMPQFRGSTENRILNIRHKIGEDGSATSWNSAVAQTFRKNIINTFTINSEDRDYGSMMTRNSLEDDTFADEISFNKDGINRIPLYGINKFSDMTDLTSDIFSGLLQYAAMAYSYQATSKIISALEVGREVLRRRTDNEGKLVESNSKNSNSYGRYCDFLDQQAYNLFANHKSHIGKLAISKIVQFLSGIATKLWLGGNVHGAIVNAFTGFNELTKEAISGEYFDLEDLTVAHELYFKYWFSNIAHSGSRAKFDKMSLFIQRFNTRNNLETFVREYSTRKWWLTRMNPFGDNLLLPYKAGDHYMQTMSYLASARHYKFIVTDESKLTKADKEKGYKQGTVVNLWEVLESSYIDPKYKNAGKKLEINPAFKFVDKEGNIRDWTEKDETDFKDICRQVNNKMHGIYNKLDKTAFHKTLFGQAVLCMRGYALGLIERRISLPHKSMITGKDEEGSLYTSLLMFLTGVYNPKVLHKAVASLVFPFGKTSKKIVKDLGFSDSQYRNLRRSWADYALIFALRALRLLAMSLVGDSDDEDDDKEEDDPIAKIEKSTERKFEKLFGDPEDSSDAEHIMYGALYYGTTRLLMEQEAYATPVGMWREEKSVLDVMPAGVSALGSLCRLGYFGISGDVYKGGIHKDESKFVVQGLKYVPYYKTYYGFNDMEKAVESTKSYQYGKVTYK